MRALMCRMGLVRDSLKLDLPVLKCYGLPLGRANTAQYGHAADVDCSAVVL
jgi:hypothetical protein